MLFLGAVPNQRRSGTGPKIDYVLEYRESETRRITPVLGWGWRARWLTLGVLGWEFEELGGWVMGRPRADYPVTRNMPKREARGCSRMGRSGGCHARQ